MFNYLLPFLYAAQPGYDCIAHFPMSSLASRLYKGAGVVLWQSCVVYESEVVDKREVTLRFEGGCLVDGNPTVYRWEGTKAGFKWHGYIENQFSSGDDGTCFVTKIPVGAYALYVASGCKSIRGDGDFKFGSPLTIGQLARFGRLSDAYPVINIDRDRDWEESLALINLFSMDLVVRLRTHDGRRLPALKMPPESSRYLRLERLLAR